MQIRIMEPLSPSQTSFPLHMHVYACIPTHMCMVAFFRKTMLIILSVLYFVFIGEKTDQQSRSSDKSISNSVFCRFHFYLM